MGDRNHRDDEDDALVASDAGEVERAGEPPVVARLVVEIRSDGSRTIARGAMEDVATGQKVAIEARGDSPLSLAMAMAKSMFRAPALARTAARALLPGRRRRKKNVSE